MRQVIFGIPPGLSFPRSFVSGFRAHFAARDPTEIARITVYLNTRRMLRAVEQEFTKTGAALLPRLRLVSELTREVEPVGLQKPISALRQRLELMPLVGALLAKEKAFAAGTAAFDLADSLATLLDEMHSEGIAASDLTKIEVADHSAHWQRSQQFLNVIAQYLDDLAAPGKHVVQRAAAMRLIETWQQKPPNDPIIIAGSTGSRATTRLLMQAIYGLPEGRIVLPGFDFDTPAATWAAMADARVGEEHPQFRYCSLIGLLGNPEVRPWVDEPAPVPARNQLISLSLRPAPVTDQWMVEGALLQDIDRATAGMTLIEAASQRAEAVSIALILREAVERGKRAALMTPDRVLTRQVTAMLQIWDIFPDDSAGEPLAMTPSGRFLRMVADIFLRNLTGEVLLALLKHPATARGGDRGEHLRHVLKLEMYIRDKKAAFINATFLRGWPVARVDPSLAVWVDWLACVLDQAENKLPTLLSQQSARHFQLCELLGRGPDGVDCGPLWATVDGAQCHAALEELAHEADATGEVTPSQFADILMSVLQQDEVRREGLYHPDVMIWGPREARSQSADVVILGGLNEGIWPASVPADPWLNRNMRLQVGLLLPERRIGLAAHDYQQAVCAAEVVLTRAKRDAQAETVASRWLNRLTGLLSGLPDNGGPEALAGMKARGSMWLTWAALLDQPIVKVPAASRPAPRPPVAHRPRQLSVTAIQTLMRDPYAVYARNILNLKTLPTLRPAPDPKLRGQIVHRILEFFLRNRRSGSDARAQLLAQADAILAEDVAWPTTRILWRARMEKAADFLLEQDAKHGGRPVMLEESKTLDLTGLRFRLTAKPDRIDELPDGRLRIIDYKTGALKSGSEQKTYAVQLLLEAYMATQGAFGEDISTDVASVAYLGLSLKPEIAETEITPEVLENIRSSLYRLIERYALPSQGYTSRRALIKENDTGDYDHLARYGEWHMTDDAVAEQVGRADP